jgi:hypothetical protein
VDLKKHGLRDERGGGANRRIESFQMTDLADAAETVGEANQFIGLRKRRRKRLFDQDVDTRFHQGSRSFKVPDRGHRDRRGLDLTVRSSQLFDGTEGAAAEFAGDDVGSSRVGIDDAHQADRFSLLRQLVIDAGVVVSKCACANHGYVDDVVGNELVFN